MNNKSGFSLVELSIVLIIIGLILGSIVGGQALIDTARVNGAVTTLQQYKSAVYNFRDKYRAVPGDMDNASSFWSTCISDTGSSNACHGDGDGVIESAVEAEHQTAYYHLSKSGLIDEVYAYSFNAATPDILTIDLGSDAKFWLLGRVALTAEAQGFLSSKYVNTISSKVGPGQSRLINDVSYAREIDVKLDDGVPNSGAFVATDGSNGTCLNSSDNSLYAPEDTSDQECIVILGL